VSSDEGSGQRSDGDETPPVRYAVRIWPRALHEIQAAADRFADISGEEIGRAWYTGILLELPKLAENPRRFSVISEGRYFAHEIRQVLYRRTPSSAAYRVLFTIAEDSLDGPLIALIHIRHAAARPISRREAQALLQPAPE